MPKTTGKNIKQPVVTIRIVPGAPTPGQKAMARKFWAKLISECKREVDNER